MGVGLEDGRIELWTPTIKAAAAGSGKGPAFTWRCLSQIDTSCVLFSLLLFPRCSVHVLSVFDCVSLICWWCSGCVTRMLCDACLGVCTLPIAKTKAQTKTRTNRRRSTRRAQAQAQPRAQPRVRVRALVPVQRQVQYGWLTRWTWRRAARTTRFDCFP